ncbi:MAG: ABC transporter substrate-binding protein [Cellvibrionaceae bacterium]|nr:ABC transporter substrate-binding protein [Cellvibrionaceae bacterium]MCV6627820.1 ABC transporter substrate-binding protein [Cellvibrionaceae bacterium]
MHHKGLLLLSVLFLLGPLAQAAKLNIGVYHYPPFVICSDSGQTIDGLDVRIVKRALLLAKLKAQFHCLPWRRLMHSVAKGQLDGGLPLRKLEQHQLWGSYVEVPLHFESFVMATSSGKEFSNRQGSDLGGKILGLENGSTISPAFRRQQQLGLFKVRTLKDTELGLKSLKRGRLDAYVGNITVIGYTAMMLGIGKQFSLLPHRITKPEGSYMVLSKLSPQTQAIAGPIASALQGLRDSGQLQAINNQFLDVELKLHDRYCPQQLDVETIDW